MFGFQSTRPRGARHNHRPDADHRRGCFNPRARGGRDMTNKVWIPACAGFNPRARGGRDQFQRSSLYGKLLFQSTRPRGARHVRLWRLKFKELVSIHAPAGGATAKTMGKTSIDCQVSIHAPAGGATSGWKKKKKGEKCFNPRARGGRDLAVSLMKNRESISVSIHAPAGGATNQSKAQTHQR